MDKNTALIFLKLVAEFAVLSLVKHSPPLLCLTLVLVCLFYGRNLLKFSKLNVDEGFDDEVMLDSGHLEDEDYDEADDDASISWINAIISKVWKSCLCKLISVERLTEILEEVAKNCEEKHPLQAKLLRRIEVEELTLGRHVKVTELSVVTKTRESLGLRLNVIYPGDASFALRLKETEIGASAEILSLKFSLLIVLEPFHSDCILGGVTVSFLGPPQLVVEGGGIIWLPVEIMMTLFRTLCLPLLEYFVVHPNEIRINFPTSSLGMPALEKQEAAGILRVMLVEGKDLRHRETSLHFKNSQASDPFAFIKVGKDWTRTQTVSKSLNPEWNFYCEFPISKPTDKIELKVELWNENRITENESLGRTSVDIGKIRSDEVMDSWLDVSSLDGPAGQVRCLLQFIPCSPEMISKQGVLVILIQFLETTKPIDPVLTLQISGQSSCYTVRGRHGDHFEFQQQLMLLVKDIDQDLVKISLGDFNQLGLDSLVMKKRKPEFSEVGFLKVNKLVDDENIDLEPVGEMTIPVREFESEDDVEFYERFNSRTFIGSKLKFSAKLFTVDDGDNELLTYFEQTVEK